MTRTLVTGSEGFIGSHLCASGLPEAVTLDKAQGAEIQADIRDRSALQGAAASLQPESVVHLAALCDVVTPWVSAGDLISTNIDGTYNTLCAWRPRRFIFASSSSVYGDGAPPRTDPGQESVRPLSLYGMSKSNGELLCATWARERGAVAVALRFANVIGERCRGLIRYLIEHALRFPDGSEPARMRGGGRLVRDYVPVSYAVRAILAALGRDYAAGLNTFNVSSGIPVTNGEVFEVVSSALARHGYRVRPQWGHAPGPGEAVHIVLDPDTMRRGLGLESPSRGEIVAAIEAAVEAGLARAITGPMERVGVRGGEEARWDFAS